MSHKNNIVFKLAVLLVTSCFPLYEGGAAGTTRQASHLDRFAIACVGQFGKLSHDHRPIASAHPFSQLQTDLIIPGIRVGAITPQTSESELQGIYGRKNVRSAEVDIGEGEREPGTVIYPDDPARTIEVTWKDAHEKRRPKLVRLTGEKSVWRTREGISLGTRLKDLERINGRPFMLTGFSYDYSGTVVSWEGGRLEKRLGKSGRVILRLSHNYKPTQGLSAEELNSVDGDRNFSSNNLVMQKINPTVYQIVIEFPED